MYPRSGFYRHLVVLLLLCLFTQTLAASVLPCLYANGSDDGSLPPCHLMQQDDELQQANDANDCVRCNLSHALGQYQLPTFRNYIDDRYSHSHDGFQQVYFYQYIPILPLRPPQA